MRCVRLFPWKFAFGPDNESERMVGHQAGSPFYNNIILIIHSSVEVEEAE